MAGRTARGPAARARQRAQDEEEARRLKQRLEAKRLAETQVAPADGRKEKGFVLAGRSRQILDVISLVARVARTDASVLIRSICETSALLTTPGLVTPGHLMIVGTR